MERGVHSVDAGLFEGAHARIMIERVVHAVNADDIDTKRLQLGDITGTSRRVGQGVYEGGGLKEGIVGVVRGLAWIPGRMVSRDPRKSG